MNNPTFVIEGSKSAEVIGLSEQQRPLAVTYIGSKDATLKVFIIAGQHGNEKYGRKAVKKLIDSLRNNFADLAHLSLAVLADANPDGSIQKTRKNTIGIDLNRDHQRLDSKEVLVIHSFVRTWRPDIIIDVHNIRSKRKDLLAKNLILYHDVFIDIPTNPAATHSLDGDKINDFLKTIQLDLGTLGFASERYAMLKRSGRVRHSTLDVNEALNSFALRYGILTILLEGRTPIREAGIADKEHVVSAQYQALLSILKWMQSHTNYFTNTTHIQAAKGDKFVLRCRYKPTDEPFKMIFRNSITKMADTITLPNNYTSKLRIAKPIELPAAYAVPSDKKKVIEILFRQGFMSYLSNPSKIENVEFYDIELRNNQISTKRIKAVHRSEQKRLENYVIFPINQEGGGSLAMFLEPRSMYGLQRYADLGLQTQPGLPYPVLRIL